MSQPLLWHHRRKWACHVNNKQVSQGCQEGQGSVWFPQSSEIRGFCKSKAGLLEAFGAPFSVYIRELSSGQGPHSLWCQRGKVWECHMRLLLPVPSGMTSGFRLLGALCVQCRGMPSLRYLTLTPGGLWISSFFQPKVTHVDQRPCPCKPWKEVRECAAWQPCLGLLRADTGQSLCDFSSSFICLYLDSCVFYERLLGKCHVFEKS